MLNPHEANTDLTKSPAAAITRVGVNGTDVLKPRFDQRDVAKQ